MSLYVVSTPGIHLMMISALSQLSSALATALCAPQAGSTGGICNPREFHTVLTEEAEMFKGFAQHVSASRSMTPGRLVLAGLMGLWCSAYRTRTSCSTFLCRSAKRKL